MEPPISPLAKRLAEENNVSWHALRGSGPAGRVVERDVLEHLAQAMSGAADPMLEGLPGGADWQESAGRQTGYGAAAGDEFDEALLELDVQAAEHPTEPAEDALTGFAFDENVFAKPDDIFMADGGEDAFEAARQNYGEDALLEGVLFEDETTPDEDAGGFFAFEGEPVGTPESLEFRAAKTGAAGAPSTDEVGDEAFEDETFAAETFNAGGAGQTRNVGNAEVFDAEVFSTENFTAPTPETEVFRADILSAEAATDLFFDPPAAPAPSLSDSEEAGFGSFEGGAEQGGRDGRFGGEADGKNNGRNDSGRRGEFGVASDAGSAAHPSDYSSSSDEDAFRFEGFGDAPEIETAPVGDAARLEQADENSLGDAPAETDFSGDVFDKEVSTDGRALERSAPSPVPPLASLPEGTPLAPYVLLRRHLDLAPLEEARRAVAQELENGERVLTALLLRATFKALRAAPLTGTAVALALTSDGAFRTAPLPDADAPFAALLEAAERLASGPTGDNEADAVNDLVVADMSRYSLDEVVLNVGAPVLALSRVGGAADARGALSLSGDVPFEEGAEFLERVAELLTSPVRLLI